MNIFKKLTELNLPLGEYVVVGSGLLAALGLREAVDLDVAVSQALFKKLLAKGNLKPETKYGRLFLVGEDLGVISRLNWDDYQTDVHEAIRTAMIIKGFPFLNINETIKFKRALGREKDRQDIDRLEKYLALG